jgi:hypothetical protein
MFSTFNLSKQKKAGQPVHISDDKKKVAVSSKDAGHHITKPHHEFRNVARDFGNIPLRDDSLSDVQRRNHVDFFSELANDPATPDFTVTNVIKENQKNMSADVYLPNTSLDARGFFRQSAAINFLKGADKTARFLDARWKVQYNDFNVLNNISDLSGELRSGYKALEDASHNLNWHAQAGLKSHFHLDLKFPEKTKPAENVKNLSTGSQDSDARNADG